jgi:filamentous hemagglutinin family protein
MKRVSRFWEKFSVSRRFGRHLTAAALLSLGLAGTALGNPSGPTVRHGQVNIVGGTQAQIQQLTDRAIVDWQSFSIGSNESVQFIQPSELSVILNRVTGGDASSILGQLRANGNIFLINPNGILFGPNSVVSVGGLVASSLNITDQDFLSGNYRFNAVEGQDLGAVVNQGTIQVTDGGYAVLTGASVINEGTIVARGGNVTLAAGEKATLNLDGRDLVHFSLDSQISDGTVLLAPGMMSDAISETLGVERYERADRLVRGADGSVRMVASSGTLIQDGTVSADAAGADAGSVLLDSTDFTLLTEGSVTSASSTGAGDGGEILVLSDMDSGTTIVESGALLATSAEAGDGGFVETSAQVVQMAGLVDGSSVSGQAGSYLLDPTTVRIVDDTFGGMAPVGESYVTDLSLEMLLDANMAATVQSDMAIISDVTVTSGGADTGIQSAGTGMLTLDTLFLNGTDVDLQSDRFILGGDFDVSTAGNPDLGTSVIDIDGFFTINSQGTSVDLGSASITADGEINIQADSGALVGNGVFMDTREDLGVFGDGGAIIMNISGDVTLQNSTLTGRNVDITGDAIDLQSTDVDVSVLAAGGAVPFVPTIVVNALSGINGPTGNNSLHGAHIILSTAGDVRANIDTSSDVAIGTATSIPTRLTVVAPGGSIDITDIAAGTPLGIDLTRPVGPGTPALDAGGDITVVSQGKIGFGSGNGTTIGDPGNGSAIVTTSDNTATMTFSAVGSLLDQNGTTGVSGPLEIIGGNTVSLSSDAGIGSLTVDPLNVGVFEVSTSNLVIDADGAATEVNVGGNNFTNIDATIEGGEFKVTEQGPGGTLQITPNGAGPDVLEVVGPALTTTNVRVSTSEDVGVQNFSFSGNTFVISTTNGARILNEDPSGLFQPSIVLGGGSRLVLSSSGDIGTQAEPFRVQGDAIFLGNTTSNVFLDLNPATAPGITIEGADPGFFSNAADNLPGVPNQTNVSVGGDLVVSASADLLLESSVVAGGVVLETSGTIDLTNATSMSDNGVSGTNGIILLANQLAGADNQLSGGVIALEIGQDVGNAANPLEIADLSGLVIGSDANRSYFLRDNGPGDATLQDSLTIGGVTITGNQVDTLQLEKTQGNLTVDTTVTGTSRVELKVASNISQGASGQLNAPAVVLDAGGNIGDINTDQQINGDTLAISSGGSAYVRDTGGDLELVDDPALSQAVGAQNDFRVRVDNGDLTVSTDVSASDIALIGGTNLEISPQTTAQDVFLAGNVSATGSLVVIAAGDIIPVSGTLSANAIGLGAGGNIGTAGNPVNLNANELAMNQPGGNVQTTGTPVSVASVTAAGATVNAQATSTPTDGTIVVDVILYPSEEVPGEVFAQDDPDMIEEFLEELRYPEDILEEVLDPTSIPVDWYNDDDFLQRKWRS